MAGSTPASLGKRLRLSDSEPKSLNDPNSPFKRADVYAALDPEWILGAVGFPPAIAYRVRIPEAASAPPRADASYPRDRPPETGPALRRSSPSLCPAYP